MRRSQAFEGYICLSAHYFDDPDIEPLPWAVKAFYLAIACRIRQLRSDGWITHTQVAKIGYPQWQSALRALLSAGKLTDHRIVAGEPAYFVPAYPKWNYTESEYEDLRDKRRRAGLKSRCVTNHGPECGCWQTQPTT